MAYLRTSCSACVDDSVYVTNLQFTDTNQIVQMDHLYSNYYTVKFIGCCKKTSRRQKMDVWCNQMSFGDGIIVLSSIVKEKRMSCFFCFLFFVFLFFVVLWLLCLARKVSCSGEVQRWVESVNRDILFFFFLFLVFLFFVQLDGGDEFLLFLFFVFLPTVRPGIEPATLEGWRHVSPRVSSFVRISRTSCVVRNGDI